MVVSVLTCCTPMIVRVYIGPCQYETNIVTLLHMLRSRAVLYMYPLTVWMLSVETQSSNSRICRMLVHACWVCACPTSLETRTEALPLLANGSIL